jgi:hydroxyacylglutathione hydrolase
MKVEDNLYAYLWNGKDNNCNAYVFAGVLEDGKHLVVDPGHVVTPYYREQGLARLLREMERDGIDGASIGMAILTHGHPDHCEAAVSLEKARNILVAMHKADEEGYQMLGGKVDFYLDEGTLNLGTAETVQLEIFHSPGHTPGHITIYWPKYKVLIAGDVLFYRSTGRTDLPGGSATILKQSVDRLAQLDIEYLLCGHPYAHPGIIKGRENVRENFEFIKRNILS